jgi:DNA-binding transcriptional ArsR family regulator
MELKEATIALAALAQETRLAIFRLLVEAGPEGVPAGQLAGALDVPPATLSFHLKELAHAGLAHARPEGRFVFYSADFERMAALMTFLTRNCCQGMPEACLTTVETALARCCPPILPSSSRRVRPKGWGGRVTAALQTQSYVPPAVKRQPKRSRP